MMNGCLDDSNDGNDTNKDDNLEKHRGTAGTKYSRMDQVKFVEDSL